MSYARSAAAMFTNTHVEYTTVSRRSVVLGWGTSPVANAGSSCLHVLHSKELIGCL